MSWKQVARITTDFVRHSGVRPIRPGESIKVFAGRGGAASISYMSGVESSFERADGVNPTTKLSDAMGMLVDDDPALAAQARSSLSEDQLSVIDAYNSEAALEEDTTVPPPTATVIPASCGDLPPANPVAAPTDPSFSNYGILLSPNFTYGQVSKFAAAGSHFIRGTANKGIYSPDALLCNLSTLCVNVLEPLAEKYGATNIQINSGFRNNGGTSQHEFGQAVDIRFLDLPTGRGDAAQRAYFERAKELRDNLVYDQLLLEVFGNQGPWIHVSFNSTFNRRLVRTFFSHTSSRPGLILVG